MNLDEAVKGHTEWKMKFRSAISKTEQMDVATIGKDDCCAVGKWLHGEGKPKFSTKPAFQRAVDTHKAFHLQAGKLAGLVNVAKYSEAEAALGLGTAYINASGDVAKALIDLKKTAGL